MAKVNLQDLSAAEIKEVIEEAKKLIDKKKIVEKSLQRNKTAAKELKQKIGLMQKVSLELELEEPEELAEALQKMQNLLLEALKIIPKASRGRRKSVVEMFNAMKEVRKSAEETEKKILDCFKSGEELTATQVKDRSNLSSYYQILQRLVKEEKLKSRPETKAEHGKKRGKPGQFYSLK